MFGKTAFIIKGILLWALITVTLVESARHKKDVHHMIYLNERRPSRSHRHKEHEHQDHYKYNMPKKSRKKPGGKKHKGPNTTEESSEKNSHEEILQHKPKPKRHHAKHPRYPARNHKRHNPRPQQYHKKQLKHDQPTYQNHKPKQPQNIPVDNWIPMNSKEFFDKDQNQYFGGNEFGRQAQGYIQPVPMEITTPLSFKPLNTYLLDSTIYPPLSLLNQKSPESPLPPLIGTVEPYKPFDYSILEQRPQPLNPSGIQQGQEVSSSNIVNVIGGKSGSPFSIIVDNSRENAEKKKQEKKKQKTNEGEGGKSDKIQEKEKRTRGRSRYRMRSRNSKN